MSENVVNTVQFRFPMGSPRPSWDEIANFLKQLDTDLMVMETAYKTAQDRSLFVKFTSQEAMTESLKKNKNPRKFVYNSGICVEVCMSIAGAQYVRVFDLPPELADDRLSLVLGKYGEIEQVVREKFPAGLGLDHLYTGVRGVYMVVKKDIPPMVEVVGRKGRIFYEGLKDTCFLCQQIGHRKDACPQRQARHKNGNKKAKSSNSYAEIVAGKQAVSELEEPEEIMDDDVIEVLEEEFVEESPEKSEAEKVSEAELEKELRRKQGIEALEEVAKAIHDAMRNPQANQRRAEFASSSSGSGSRPKKKIARKVLY